MALACFVTHETVEPLYLLKRFISIQDIKTETEGLAFRFKNWHNETYLKGCFKKGVTWQIKIRFYKHYHLREE